MNKILLQATGKTLKSDKKGCYVLSKVHCSPLSRAYNESTRLIATKQFEYNHSGHNGKAKTWSKIAFSAMLGGSLALYLAKNKLTVHNQTNYTESEEEKWKGVSITLYQYQTCPFCSKTRSFLQAYNVPFKSVEVHPIFKKEIKFSEYKKVPIVSIEKEGKSEQLNDSSLIISVLASYLINENISISELLNQYPESELIDEDGKVKKLILNKHWLIMEENEVTLPNYKDARSEEAQWRAWADDYLVHLISPNVYRTLSEALQAFDYHVKQGRFNGTWEGTVAKYGGAVAMWVIGKRLKKKYKISENVRIDLYKACNTWVKAIGHDRKFMGGDKPNLADICVFGVLSVMENLDSFNDVVTHSKIKKWYFATKKAIEEHKGQNLNAT
uniref:Prostaglandin E synthase 2 n=1 Tax=Phallusia mammillata TaxID=59560 RepID=A0A6F9DQK0_9ASCI|nr:prostaglandin E synthase 2 [Phallusia mammillata]